MKIKKLIISSFLVLSLVSCHGTLVPKNQVINIDNSFTMPEEFDENKIQEISFWTKNDSDKTQQKIYKDAASEFSKIYPNIKINIKQYTNYNDIHRDVVTALSNNTTPNICITYPDYVASYKTGKNVVYELDDLINDPNYGLGGSKVKFASPKKEEMITKFLDEGKIDDKYYTLPFMRSSECLYYNKTYLLENGFEIPEVFSWDYIWEICSYIHNKSAAEATSLGKKDEMIPFIYKSSDNMFINLCYQNSNPYTNEAGDILMFNDKNNKMLLDLYGHFQNKLYDLFATVSYPGNHMNKGNCIFAIDSTAGATWMGSSAPNLDIDRSEVVEFETGVSMIPQVDVNNPLMISQGPSMCLFNSGDSQKDLASWLFMQYLLTNDVQLKYAKTEGYVPVTKLAIESDEYNSYLNDANEYNVKIMATNVVLDNINNTFITPVFNGSSKCRSAATYLINSISGGDFGTKEKIDNLFKMAKDRYF